MEKHDILDQSPSDHEKPMEETLEDRLNKEIPDPDAHLSETERAAIVSSQAYSIMRTSLTFN